MLKQSVLMCGAALIVFICAIAAAGEGDSEKGFIDSTHAVVDQFILTFSEAYDMAKQAGLA